MIYDPDYSRAYSIIRCLAWSYGYAACLHGSFTRDLDVVLVPWTETTAPPDPVIAMMAEQTGTRLQHGSPSSKPHGRQCWTLLFPAFGDPRWIDLSVMPRARAHPAPAPLTDEQVRADETFMALNASLGMSMVQIMALVRCVERAHGIGQAKPAGGAP